MFSDMSEEEEACLLIILAAELKKKSKNKKRKWMREFFRKREKFTHEKLLKELRDCEPHDFRNFLCMDTPTIDDLLKKVTPLIEKQNTLLRDSITASQRLSITLRYLATGKSFEDLKLVSAISPQCIGKIVMETCQALIKVLKDSIKIPSTEQEWKIVADGFEKQWNFPNCIGAVDGKHVAIKKPIDSGSSYYNYKKFFSIVLMGAVNANYELIMVDAGTNGRIFDGGVLGHSKFEKTLFNKTLNIPQPEVLPHSNKKLPYVFVGDDAFPLTDNLMKPYSQTGLTLEKRIYNYRLSRARRIAENAFGILTSRFGVFQQTINLSPDKAQIVALTCCYLHNYLIQNLKGSYIPCGSVDFEDIETSKVFTGTWRAQTDNTSLAASYSGNATMSAKKVRDAYCNYFNNEGKVPWQNSFL